MKFNKINSVLLAIAMLFTMLGVVTAFNVSASNTILIDWDVNTNFWADGSNIVSKDSNGITVTKASGKNLIGSSGNNLSGCDGVVFSVTPNSGNQKTTLEVQVGSDGSKTATFAIGSGTTSCTLSFADYSITPDSSMVLYIRATGGDASNLTISDIYAYTGQPSSEVPSSTNEPTSQSETIINDAMLIDWDVNTNYWKEGSTISTSVADCITVTKSSGAKLISSNNNNLVGYSGIIFSVTPNSGNEKTTLEIQVGEDGSKTATFAIGSGTTGCVLSFDDYSITTTSDMTLYIRATGGDVSNLTISDIYAYIGSSIQKTECTLAPQDTYSLTKFIDWDVNTNYWKEGSTISTSVADCITVTKASGKNLISSNNNNLVGYNGLKFSVTPNSGNQKTTLAVQVGSDGSKTASFTIGSGTTNCVLPFDDYDITPNSSMYIYIRATDGGDATDITISDIYAYTGTLIPDLTLTMVPGASIRIGSVNGIRFTTSVNEDQLAYFNSKGYTVELGTLIAPADKVDGYLTFDSASKLDVPYNYDLVGGTMRGSIVSIKETNSYNATSGNIARTFIARGYAKITKNSVTTIVYSTGNSDGRSLAEISSAFQADPAYSALSNAQKALVDRWASFL